VLLSSCATKKEILYLQDIDQRNNAPVLYTESEIQPNDLLSIMVVTVNPETAQPYNLQNNNQGGGGGGGQMLQLQGYLVAPDYTINFPILGQLSVANMTTRQLADDIKARLETGGHLINPTVNVRLMNGKITVLGAVRSPGTINFTEQNITLLQAIGLAGDLSINGVREDVVLIRDEKGVQQITHIDLTKSDWMNGPYYFVRPNDVIIVNQNGPEVKRAGYIPNLGALLGFISAGITLTFLLTR
jgi:polysaccharide export outer membrane protein